jgi:phage terminase large subunit GpA-like protein
MESGLLEISPERGFLVDLAGNCMQPTPTLPGWQWAAKNVWLDEKQTATPGYYDPEATPWAKEWHQIPLQPETREVIIMKSSRSGASEAWLNVLRWMPEHWPGNALFAINSKEKAREVSKKRILPTLARTAGAQMPEGRDDIATLLISLKNMDIVVSGSGSAGPFMEAWYRLILLDELENHEQNQETTTYDRARSRQATVPDGKLVAMSKPELAGGIIDANYIRGTQEKWMVPCPRCERLQELTLPFLTFSHCRDLAQGWDLTRVMAETYYQCRHCSGRIEEREKRMMVNAGEWVPTPIEQRRRPPSGNIVAAEPGVRSFHISDLYSLFDAVSWGFLAKEYLTAYVIDPNESRMKYFRTNHEGLPWEPKEMSLDEDAILALRGGIVEERAGRKVVIGESFELSYVDGKTHAEIPFRPKLLTFSADKQADCYKFGVVAWKGDGQAWLVDYGELRDDDDLLEMRNRPYAIAGHSEPAYIFSGLVDCGDRTMDVYRLCLSAQDMGWQLHPSRGSGWNSHFQGKTINYKLDYCDQRQLYVRVFLDHRIKSDLYLGKIAKRSDPRLWFPKNITPEFCAELRAERLIVQLINGRPVQKWTHEKHKHGPNDYGDMMKQHYVMFQEFSEDLAFLPDLPLDPPPETSPPVR